MSEYKGHKNMQPERYHDLPKRTGTDRNGPERTETDRNGPKRTFVDTETDSLNTETDSLGTETDRNGPKRTFVHTETDCLSTETDSLGTETDFCDYRNGLCGYRIEIWGVKVDRNRKNRYKFSTRNGLSGYRNGLSGYQNGLFWPPKRTL